MAIQHRAKTERVYVKVDSSFDPTGFMQPTSITWSDGRTFPIEIVRDFRPAGTADNGYSGDCFTVLITRVQNAPLDTSTRLPQIWSWQIPPALRKPSVSLCLLP